MKKLYCILALILFINFSLSAHSFPISKSNVLLTEISITDSSIKFSKIQSPSDTLIIDKKSVIFFVLDKSEFETLLVKEGKNSADAEQQYAEFFKSHREIKQHLSELGISSEVVHHKVFKIVTLKGIEYFNRTENAGAEIGVIIFDGINKPVIEFDINEKVESSIMKMVEAKSNE